MSEVHHLLARQLRNAARVSPDGQVCIDALIALVSKSYSESDRDRMLAERAARLVEKELLAANARDAAAHTVHAELLENARAAAEESSRLKSHFLATMSHELRTPLNAILGFSEIIRDRTFGEKADRYAEYAAHIHSSGKHLLSLIDGILDLSKIESGRDDLHEVPVCLGELALDCLTLIQPVADQGQVTLVSEIAAGAVTVLGDARALKQVLLNLLSNAVKFTDAGGIVTLNLNANAATISLSIRDTGIGISPEFLPNVFDAFRQENSHHARPHKGSGLGLAITKRLIEAHDGRIAIASELGRGTTITVEFNRLKLKRRAHYSSIE